MVYKEPPADVARGTWKAVKGDRKKLASNVGLRWDGDPPVHFLSS